MLTVYPNHQKKRSRA